MRGGEEAWRWGTGLLAVAGLVLAGCGDSGSVSRQAAGLTASTTASEETRTVEAEKKKGGDDRGKHKGRPRGEVQGVVSGLAGTCPTRTFTVDGVSVRVNGVTEFESAVAATSLTCGTLANNTVVKVEGQPLGDTILAREVKLLSLTLIAPPPTPAGGVQVSLVSVSTTIGPVATPANGGEFEFENVAPGTYKLLAAFNGCSTTLATGISLVAQRNEVEGKLTKTTAEPTQANSCALILAKLEVKQGARD